MKKIRDLACSALGHSDHVEQIVRWALLRVVHVENDNAGRIQDCLTHLGQMQDDLKELVADTRRIG